MIVSDTEVSEKSEMIIGIHNRGCLQRMSLLVAGAPQSTSVSLLTGIHSTHTKADMIELELAYAYQGRNNPIDIVCASM